MGPNRGGFCLFTIIDTIRIVYNKKICVRCAINILIHTQNYPSFTEVCDVYYRWGQVHGMVLRGGLIDEICIYLKKDGETKLFSFKLAPDQVLKARPYNWRHEPTLRRGK